MNTKSEHKDCPFCNNPKKSEWFYEDNDVVVAEDADKPGQIIAFPKKHIDQGTFLTDPKYAWVWKLVEVYMTKKYGPEIGVIYDVVIKKYKHAHVQAKKGKAIDD